MSIEAKGGAPKVSVLMPTFDQEAYVAEAVDSVLAQSYGDFELVVVDDASRDGTAEIVRGFEARDGRVRVLVNPGNLGMVENWNRCLAEARGDYVKFLFGDDRFVSPEAIGRLVAALESDPRAALATSARVFVDGDSREIRTVSPFRGTGPREGNDVIAACLVRQGNLVGEPSAVIFRRTDGANEFDPAFRQWVDLEMWFRLLEGRKMVFVDEPLTAFRIHPGQQTAANRKALGHLDEMLLLLDRYLGRPYVRLSSADKWYLAYDAFHRCFAIAPGDDAGEYRKGLRGRIDARYGYGRFLALLPAHRAWWVVRKARNLLRKIGGDAL